jgi:Haem-NO-binding
MKGIVFTQFFEMVEEKFEYKMVDDLLNTTELPSGGIYTAVGTYSHQEIINLVVNLSEKTNIPLTALLRAFGQHLFKTFVKNYHFSIVKATNAFELLSSTHDYIHVEVKKLYPDAELPNFEIEKVDDLNLIMYYKSNRKMADLAYGLIEGCLEHYGEKAIIMQESLNEDGSSVKFLITKF